MTVKMNKRNITQDEIDRLYKHDRMLFWVLKDPLTAAEILNQKADHVFQDRYAAIAKEAGE